MATSSERPNTRQFVATFVTKDIRYAIPSTPYSLLGSSSGLELNNLVKTLISEKCENGDELADLQFDFIINGKLLRSSLEEFAQSQALNVENQIEIEFIVKWCPPKPHNSFLHDDWVSSVDGLNTLIISGCYDSSVHIWDLSAEASHRIAIPAHLAPVKAVKWIPDHNNSSADDHTFVTTSHDETAIVWKWRPQNNQVEYLFSCRGHSRSVDCVDVSNDLIATGSYDQMVKIWSLAQEDESSEASEPSTSKQKKLKKNDGSQGDDKNRTPIITMSGHKEAITGCAWIKADNSIAKIATCSMDNTIRLWDVEVGDSTQTLTGNKAFLSVSYSPLNHCLITGSCDRHIRLWDPRTSEGSLVRQIYSSHQSWVSSVDWSQANPHLFISGSYDNVVKQWDVRSSNAPLYDLIGHEDKVLCVNWSTDQYMVSGGADNHLKIFANTGNTEKK